MVGGAWYGRIVSQVCRVWQGDDDGAAMHDGYPDTQRDDNGKSACPVDTEVQQYKNP